jgi:hypothetical protein
MGFKTGKHGKVYNDDKKSHGSKSNSPGVHDGSDEYSRDELHGGYSTKEMWETADYQFLSSILEDAELNDSDYWWDILENEKPKPSWNSISKSDKEKIAKVLKSDAKQQHDEEMEKIDYDDSLDDYQKGSAKWEKLTQKEKVKVMAQTFNIVEEHVDTSGFEFEDFDARDMDMSDNRSIALNNIDNL